MADVKFGIAQFSAPTPAGISKTVKVLSITIGVFILWMNSDQGLIGDETARVLNSLGGLVTALINALAPFFGIDIAPTASVPAKNVDVMDNPQPVKKSKR